ncbi:MAG: hypothetical protein SFY80_06195 [Verrucomicrobiota bacterium]|nr:hypothetical protein [Verrucomicrobiota bacterium]
MPPVFADIAWEKVAPIIFFALFYVAKVFFERRQDNEGPPVDQAEQERARRLQEEIRRAIAERAKREQEHQQQPQTHQPPQHAPSTPPPPPLPTQHRPAPPLTAPRPIHQPSIPLPPRRALENKHPTPRAMPQREVRHVEVKPVFVEQAESEAEHATIASMQGSGLSTRQLFERQMAADYAAAYSTAATDVTTKVAPSNFGNELIKTLTNRDSLRRAFVTAEILGPPVATKY